MVETLSWSLVRRLSAVVAVAGVTVVAGCDDDVADAAPPEVVTPRVLADNGWELNAAGFNGWELNGWELNGWELNGWELNGWELNGVALEGSSFVGTKVVDGVPVPVAGLDFIGAEISLANAEQSVTLRIEDIRPGPTSAGGDVYFYDISVQDPDTLTWSSLCHDGQGAATAAIPLTGAWSMETGARLANSGAVTLACRGAALAKCVEWGYRPWATATQCVGGECSAVSLADHHQACTRMVRADYCGDGTPHTFNGTPIDVIDRLSPPVQAESTAANSAWGVEAEWGPDGARCVGSQRRLHMYDDMNIPYETPACLAALDDHADCGTMPTARGARLLNKFCEAWTSNPASCGSAEAVNATH